MKSKYIVLLSFFVTGCSSFDFTKLPDDPLGPFTSTRAKSRQLEANLIRDYQHDDRILNYLSNENYSCDDPKINRNYKTEKITKIIKKEDSDIDQKIEKGMKILNNYADLIKNIKEQSVYTKKSIENLESSLKLFGDITGTRANLVAGAIAQLAQVSRQAYWQQQLYVTALSLSDVNNVNLDMLEKNLGSHLKAKRDIAFRLWDTCAREKLIFLRDAPLNKNTSVSTVAAKASIVDLADAYKNYLEKRDEYLEETDIKQALKKIRAKNYELIEALKEQDFNKTIENSNSLIESIHTINTKT